MRFNQLSDCLVLMNKTKIYLIPHWAIDAFARRQLNPSTILSLKDVREQLSVKDIAGLVALHKFDNYLLGGQNIEFSSNIFYEWSVSATPKDQSFLYDQIQPLSADESVLNMVRVRLFTPENDAAGTAQGDVNFSSSSKSDVKAYTIVSLDNNAIGVVLNAHGLVPGVLLSQRLSLIRDILKQLYVYESQAVVAKSPLYLRYLELLLNV